MTFVTLVVDACLLGRVFRRGTTVAVGPALAHLARQLVESGAAVEAA